MSRAIQSAKASIETTVQVQKDNDGLQSGCGSEPNKTKRIKLSSVIDPCLDIETSVITPNIISDMFIRFKNLYGKEPGPEHEPTVEQLTGVNDLIQSGANPYVDFAIFGPFGRRSSRKLTFVSHVFSALTGEWRKQELPGPNSFEDWLKCWMVYRTTLMLLDITPPEPLVAYAEHVRSLASEFGPSCWFLIYQADVRMRSEEFERLRRRIIAQNPDATTKETWTYVVATAVDPEDGKSNTFWQSEVKDKCILYITRTRSARQLTDDCTVGGLAEFQMSGGTRKGKKGSGKQRKADFAATSHNLAHAQICRAYNSGTCQSDAQGNCPAGRIHKCDICYGPHPSIEHAKHTKGKKGKGKGRKAYKTKY